jgi:hypothetical protein
VLVCVTLKFCDCNRFAQAVLRQGNCIMVYEIRNWIASGSGDGCTSTWLTSRTHHTMDVLYKGGSLIYTQITAVARMVCMLPVLVVANVFQHQSAAQQQQHPGATFYDGKVIHSRRQPVHNSFE